MKPEEALYHLIHHAGTVPVPAFYRNMPRPQLEALVQECDRPSAAERSEAALTRWAQQRMKMPGWVGHKDTAREMPAADDTAPATPTEPALEEPTTLVGRAIQKPERLSTPRRRQAAFVTHFARCSSTIEAAARAGIDRRTVQRWRKTYPVFDRKCRDIVEARRRQAIENVVLAAGQVEVRPVFYRGRKIGEQTRRDRTLDLHLLKQADAAALREEKRHDAERDFEGRVAAEVERRVSEMSRSPRQVTPPAEDEFSNAANDIEPAGCDIAVAR
jgi:hypothetical protein